MIIDAWMQHPSAAFLAEPMFDSLHRWAHGRLGDGSEEIPAEATVAAMDAAGVRTGMLCAWWGPRGPLIPNDSVAAMVTAHPGRFAGVASVDLARPMDVYIDTSAYKTRLTSPGTRYPAAVSHRPPGTERIHSRCALTAV